MTTTPTPAPSDPFTFRASDREAIRIALSIPLLADSLRAITEAMAALEQTCPEAIPTAQAELAAVAGAIDADATIDSWNASGYGPPFVRLGYLVRYTYEDVEVWIARQVELSRG